MSLVLTVDGDRWRAHLRSVADATPGLVPVAKGNGYGFTLARLARRAEWLGTDTLAVGMYEELPHVATRFPGLLLVLTPWRPWMAPLPAALASRVVHTVSRPADLPALLAASPGARYVLELGTSMQRHGMTGPALWSLSEARPEGIAIHLPLATGSHLPEVRRLLTDATGADLPTRTVYVSHLSAAELATLRAAYPELTFRPRTGTALWLGDRGALGVTSRVLDVHRVARGASYGYRQRSAPRDGHLVIVSGGTAHGIGLEAPMGASGFRARASAAARGGLNALGLTRSPFWVGGAQRFFAEPPHMQASMLFLPGDDAPEIGDVVEARVRFTTTAFDDVVTT